MRISTILPSLVSAVVLVTTGVHTQAIPPASAPTFEPLFIGTFDVGDVETIQGPFGTRMHVAIPGGNLTDSAGKLVATALPSADNGLVGSNGRFYPDMVVPLRWEMDGKMAYMSIAGNGILGVTDLSYAHVETDSPTYKGLNDRFLVVNITFRGGVGVDPVWTIFGAL
ncbi:hypothetical protein C8Q80DRAFT_858471 [Daedaleopsis nitida]|nr:hypothetical protein C8Q80DRAFT_858471 [Daedaleopsis nitida]